jgi:hypothetical protein
MIIISENKKRITLTKYVFTTNYNQSYRLKKKEKNTVKNPINDEIA